MDFIESWNRKNDAQKAASAASALSFIDCSKFTYNPWLGVAAAFKDAGGTFEDYCAWCNRYEGGVPEDVRPQKWQHLPSNPQQFSFLWTTAKQFGWEGSGIKTGKFEKPWLTVEEERKRVAADEERARVHEENRKKVFATIRESQLKPDAAIHYLVDKRGLSENVCRAAGVGTLYKNGHAYALIPYGKGIAFYNARRIDIEIDARGAAKCDKPSNEYGDGQSLYHADRLANAEPDDVVFFMEGEIDALTCESAGFAACSGTPTDLQKALKASGTKAAAVVVVADNDEHGESAAVKAVEVLHAAGVHAMTVRPEIGKDVNAFKRTDCKRFESWITRAADDAEAEARRAADEIGREYRSTMQAAAMMNDFDEHFANRGNAVSTGFKNLDNILDGGLYNELYVIGAVSSLGKTALTMQIADNIAATGRDVLIVSLEMGKYELMARSISRCSTIIANKGLWQTQRAIERGGRDDAGAVNPDVETVIQTAKAAYMEYANHIYITEGGNFSVWNVCEAVKNHIAVTGNTPIVFVDYLQILENQKGHEHDTDKQKADNAIKTLKSLVNRYSVPVVVISAFNRENYGEKVNQRAFKESGGIEYTAGVLLGMQLSVYRGTINCSTGEPEKGNMPTADDIEAAISADVRMIDVKVLKQRAGRIGQYCTFDFRGAYSRFDEHVCGHIYPL